MTKYLPTFINYRKQLPLPFRMGYGWLRRKLSPHPIFDNKDFQAYFQWLLKSQWWSLEQLRAFQLDELKRLVKHAYENVPYYRRIFDECRLKPADVLTLDDVQKLPILTKKDVRNNTDDLIARNFDRPRLRCVTTGGSTGQPLALYEDSYTRDLHEAAFILRQWDWADYQFGDRFVTLRGNVIHRLERDGKRAWWDYNNDSNELVLSSFDMSEENMHKYVELVRGFKPRFIQAYPSSLEVLGRFMRRNRLAPIKVKAVFLESETVYPWQREIIESQFDCEIFAGYGLTERVADAVECEQHQGYHVSMEYGLLELLDQNNEPITEPGTAGRVAGTGFDTFCMPFIRYVTDDMAEYAASTCTCKRQSTLIQDFKGRLRELVFSKSGHIVPFGPVYGSIHGPIGAKIRELKFLQEREGELVMQIAKAPTFSEAEVEKEFLDELYDRLDKKEFSARIVFVDHVPRTGRGKLGLLEQRLPIDFRDLGRV